MDAQLAVPVCCAQAFVVCLLVAIHYTQEQAHYVMLGLMVDFALRFVGGKVYCSSSQDNVRTDF